VSGKLEVADLEPAQRSSVGSLLAGLAPEAWSRSPELSKALA
jgi:hypothetical protein